MPGFAYRGHYVRLAPEESGGRWEARVLIEVHAKGQTERIWYRDHLSSHATEEEAREASREFGRRMIDEFTVPAFGEGDFQGPQ